MNAGLLLQYAIIAAVAAYHAAVRPSHLAWSIAGALASIALLGSVNLAMLLGHVAIFAFGLIWLTSLIGFEKAWLLGVVPFYAATLFKTALGACAVPALWQLAKR